MSARDVGRRTVCATTPALIDSADAVAEGKLEQLRYLVGAARTANVGVIAITAADSKQVVRDIARNALAPMSLSALCPLSLTPQIDEVVAIVRRAGQPRR